MLPRLLQLASRIFRDFRHGLRLLARRPAFAAVAVLTLAIGAGASSAVFSAVRTVLLAPLPFRSPGRLVTVWDQNLGARVTRSPVSDANYADWRRLNRCFSAMAAYDVWEPTLWQRRFGGDPRIIGQRIQFSDRVVAVAGVMPPDFMHPGPDIRGVAVKIWNAKRFQAESDRRNDHLYVIARLKPEIGPPAIARHGETLGFFIPAKKRSRKAEVQALGAAAKELGCNDRNLVHVGGGACWRV